MATARDREIRRHALRFLAAEPDGRQNSRILYQQLIDYGHRLVWTDFDRLILYLELAQLVTVRNLEPEISAVRMITITKRGLDVLEGTLEEPGVLPPSQRQG